MDKKKYILETATQLFAERGFEDTSVALICERAEVSKGLVFHHFKSKNGLLRAIFENTTNDMIQLVNEKDKSLSASERLSNLITDIFEQLKKDKTLFQLNLNVILQPKTNQILKDLIDIRASFILEFVKPIFEELTPDTSLLNSYLFIAEIDGIALSYLYVYDNYALDAIQNQLIQKYTF